MEVCDVTVKHGGRLEMSVRKKGVTVPEIAVLRQIHGSDAVNEITPRGMSRRPHATELDRLRHLYEPRLQDGAHPVDELWPGTQQQKLPVHLSDIGIGPDSPFLGNPPKSAPAEDAINYHRMDDDLDAAYSDDEEEALDAAAAAEAKKSADAAAAAEAAKAKAAQKPAAQAGA